MEHRLIQGGEQWLPFARSRIKALKATGLKYASQQFEIDGVLVRVCIANDQEYIRIDGEQAYSISMDSGMVDLLGIGENSPFKYLPGKMQDTAGTQLYNVSFIDDENARWRVNDDAGSAGQLAGTIRLTKGIKGKLLPASSAPPSFTPTYEKYQPPGSEPVWRAMAQDDELWIKKITTYACPASIFTGRCRLYVQAMYGAPLKKYADNSRPQSPKPPTVAFGLVDGGPPALRVPAYKRESDDKEYSPILVSTNTGVYFDSTYGSHWLLVIEGEHLTVYPLVSSRAGEVARSFLKDTPPKGYDALSQDDKEKLEAFVLSECLPDAANKQSIHLGGNAPSSYSCGYGWHWNWSGTVADIVVNDMFDQPKDGMFFQQAMESTHYRITVTPGSPAVSAKDEQQETLAVPFTAARGIQEGPTRWAVHRAYWAIAEPIWGAVRSMNWITPKRSMLFDCDAPFYVFYKRDEIQICRVSVALVPATPTRREISPGFASPIYLGVVGAGTAGLRTGFAEDFESVSAHSVASFSCGSTSVSGLKFPNTKVSARYEVTNKRIVAEATYTALIVAAPYNAEYFYGYGSDESGGGGTFQSTTLFSIKQYDSPPSIGYDYTTNKRTINESSIATILIPFNDAEAVYLQAAAYKTENVTDRTTRPQLSTGLASSTHPLFRTLVGAPGAPESYYRYDHGDFFYQYQTGGLSPVGPVVNEDPIITNSDAILASDLICKAGSIRLDMPDLETFHNWDLGEPTAIYSAWSGVRTVQPVVFSRTRIVPPVGISIEDVPQYPALVGWV